MYQTQFISKKKKHKNSLFAPVLSRSVILLNGDLGAGKTTFAQVCQRLKIEIVNSPTFNIVKCYFNGNMPFLYSVSTCGVKQDLGGMNILKVMVYL